MRTVIGFAKQSVCRSSAPPTFARVQVRLVDERPHGVHAQGRPQLRCRRVRDGLASRASACDSVAPLISWELAAQPMLSRQGGPRCSSRREVMKRSGVKKERITFIFDESNALGPAFLERMNALLASGEVPGLFEGDEYTTLMNECRRALRPPAPTPRRVQVESTSLFPNSPSLSPPLDPNLRTTSVAGLSGKSAVVLLFSLWAPFSVAAPSLLPPPGCRGFGGIARVPDWLGCTLRSLRMHFRELVINRWRWIRRGTPSTFCE